MAWKPSTNEAAGCPLFQRALEVMVNGALFPTCGCSTQVFERYRRMFFPWFNGHVNAFLAEHPLNVHR